MESGGEHIAIRSLFVEPDRKNPGKYWIWLKIHSPVQTIARIEARVDEPDIDSNKPAKDSAVKKKCYFMGHHGLKVGENELPPLPLCLGKETAGRDVTVNFGVKSQRNPALFHYMSEVIKTGTLQES